MCFIAFRPLSCAPPRPAPPAPRRILDWPAHRRVLHLLRPFSFVVRHRPARSRGGSKLGVRELEQHVHIVAPRGALVHTVPAGARDWIASPEVATRLTRS